MIYIPSIFLLHIARVLTGKIYLKRWAEIETHNPLLDITKMMVFRYILQDLFFIETTQSKNKEIFIFARCSIYLLLFHYTTHVEFIVINKFQLLDSF